MSEVIETKQLHFYLTGEGYTRLVRDFWNSNLVKLAIGASTESGIPEDVAVKICTGEYKCVGDTREGDHTLSIEDDDTPEGIYFTVESQLSYLENKFVTLSQTLTQKIRKHELFSGYDSEKGYIAGEMSIDGAYYRIKDARFYAQVIETLKEDRKKVLENLEILYKILGKNITDLPIETIGTAWSDIEIEHFDKYDNRTSEIRKTEPASKFESQFDESSYDQGEDESDVDYTVRMRRMSEQTNTISDITDESFQNAWISPKGIVYSVERQPFPMHINAANDYVYMGIVPVGTNNESQWLDENGWMKLTSNSFYIDKRLTQKQIDVLMDFMTSRNLKTISWIGIETKLKDVIEDNEGLATFRESEI